MSVVAWVGLLGCGRGDPGGAETVARQPSLGALDPRDKMILRMSLVDGLSLERIGKVYGVHQTTVTRWLANARETVVTEAKRLLRDQLQLAPSEFDSLARLLISQRRSYGWPRFNQPVPLGLYL